MVSDNILLPGTSCLVQHVLRTIFISMKSVDIPLLSTKKKERKEKVATEHKK
jgi:hypothetical protein